MGKPFHAMETTLLTEAKPMVRGMGQDRFEALLSRHLEALGCKVERGTELRSFTQDADLVHVELAESDGNVERAGFESMVGADGGHSAVRKGLGLSFLGETREEQAMVVGDIEVKKGLSDVSFCVCRWLFRLLS